MPSASLVYNQPDRSFYYSSLVSFFEVEAQGYKISIYPFFVDPKEELIALALSQVLGLGFKDSILAMKFRHSITSMGNHE